MIKKFFAIAALSIVGAFGLFSAPVSADTALTGWSKGALMQPTYNTDFSSANYQQSVRNLAATGANYVTLVIPVRQDNIYSSNIYADGTTPTDTALADGIRFARSQGLQVALSMHVNTNNWRAYINPTDRNAWFANYSAVINRYATIGQANGATQFVLATELSELTDPTVNAANTAGWTSIINSVRTKFSGTLSYSAQHNGFKGDAQKLEFWPLLDQIGISAYYSMNSNTATVTDMQNVWKQVDQNEISALATKYGKPVVFTEVGYVSGSNGLRDPGSAYENPGAPSMTNQANAYEALFSYWSQRPYFYGVQFWEWQTNPNAGGVNDTGYTPQNKPAEDTMQRWFTGGGTGPATPVAPAPLNTYMVTSNSISSTVGAATTTSIQVSSTQTAANVLVDVEIYDSAGQKVAQKFYTGQTVGSTPASYSAVWTPAQAGQYTIKAGVFTDAWQSNLYWNNAVKTITIGSQTQPEPTPEPAPAPTPAPTPTPAPAPVVVPATANLSIWWPSNGSTVSGVQPFKAVVDGLDVRTYTMHWQVDGGQLNLMNDNFTGAPHKRSDVDLTFWNWRGNGGQYVVNFIAKDSTGKTIAQKSTTITIFN